MRGKYPPGEVAARGDAIYAEIKPRLGDLEKGTFVVIDIESGDYEIAPDDATATCGCLIDDRRPTHGQCASVTGRRTRTLVPSPRADRMPSGQVSAYGEALITIDVLDRGGRPESLEAVLDTGFTGSLTLPARLIRQLDLLEAGERIFELADGGIVEFPAYNAWVLWHGRRRRVVVLESETAPLLGMELIWGSRVTMDALAGGSVEIEELAVDL